MSLPDHVKEEITARFRAKYIQDRAANAIRDLAAYLADLPPEHQDLIAAEYVAMRGIALVSEPDSVESVRLSRLSEPADDAIGPYKILRELGRGGQATVYLADDLRLHRQVALKVLDSGITSNRASFARFRREAAITSMLDHAGICTVYETGEDRGALWIAMRYVEGESLARKIASSREREGPDDPAAAGPSPDSVTGPKTWGEVTRLLKVFEDVARALHAAHEAGVVHRDIKPGNLMVTKEGDPVILDFGLAQELGGNHPTLTVTGDMMGTPAYMSPEQITAEEIRLDRRTDVYSLGISLYECLTLRRPFDAPTREGLYKQILTKDPPDLRTANRSISSDLKVVVETALEKDRDRRYQTALDLAEELRRVRMREPILAKPVGYLIRLQRWAQRNPALATMTGGMFLALTIGLVGALFLLGARDQALVEKESARSSLATSVADYDRLGDMSRLQALQAEAETLWPCELSKVPVMKAWVDSGADLERRLPGHREVLERLRGSPDVVSKEQATYRFTTTTQQFKHDTTAKLVADLTTFVAHDRHTGLLADIRARISFAESVERETIVKCGAKWVEAIQAIADETECPKYRGLVIGPQLGLIPIGKDRASGLWEFAHLQTSGSGTDPIPKRDKDGRIVVTESISIVFVLIPGGTFRMGAMKPRADQARTDPNVDPDAYGNEGPITEIALDPFFLSKYEMTQGQWLRLVGKNPSHYGPHSSFAARVGDLRNPVEQVSWEDCDLWLARLGLVLPTEAQWEYASRGGTTTPRWTGLGTEGLAKAANLADAYWRDNGGPPGLAYESWNDGYSVHAPVGSFAANAFGLHDVLGNIWEWCRDWSGGYDLPAREGDGLRSPSAQRVRVFRGGSCDFDASTARSAFRGSDSPAYRADTVGVRPARSVHHD